jgi:hypothetical protein
MEGHQGMPEPYIILEESVAEAIYDSPEGGDNATGQSPEISPLPPKDVSEDKNPDSR